MEKDSRFSQDVGYNQKMLLLDPQTSGGLLMTVPQSTIHSLVEALRQKGYPKSTMIGEVIPYSGRSLVIQ